MTISIMRSKAALTPEAGTTVAPHLVPRDRDPDVLRFRRALLSTAWALVVIGLAGIVGLRRDATITSFYFARDLIGLAALAAILVAAALLRAPPALGGWLGLAARPRATAVVLALVVAVAALAGTALVFDGTPIAYDEVMAEFDAAIFRSGRLIVALPAEWRAFLPALLPYFNLPVPGDGAWVSAYLPVAAMLRAGLGAVAHPAVTNPLLAAVAVVALIAVARRLWPGRPDAAILAGLLLVTAPQVLFTAMTAFAMTAHLALNLVWLRCFLRGGRLGHGGAAVIGFLACGLHQVVFHPLFALPFLVGIVLRRHWGLAAFYAAIYAASGAVWILYWQGVLTLAGLGREGAATVGGGYLLARLATMVEGFGWVGLNLMIKNLLRFVAWGSPLLLPLAALSWPALRRGEGVARPLAAGIGLTLVAMLVLMPLQGHGWGYRYLHGLVGSACLLAAQGWVSLTARCDTGRRREMAAAFGAACAASLLLVVPARALEIRAFVRPYASAIRAITTTDADFVVVDDRGLMAYGADLVRNDPFLRNRPMVLLLDRLDAAARAELCRRGSVAIFTPVDGARLGIMTADRPLNRDQAPPLPCASRPVLEP
ncbi:hypothetical protein [Methylobacterium sp. ID0610]|uniref:hypothetical protein n=1 Tax=Methylobacterium carpenticola TaxID=3344827 RepID=UPI003675FC74